MKKRNKKQNIKFIVSILIVISIFAIITYTFTLTFKNTFNKEIKTSLNTYSIQVRDSLNNQMKYYLQQLEEKSEMIAKDLNAFNKEEIMNVLSKSNYNLNYPMAISDEFGNAYTKDGNYINIYERDYFHESLSGKSVFQEVKKNANDYDIYCSVPIIKDDIIHGVLFLQYNKDLFYNVLNASPLGENEFSCLINREGNVFISSNNFPDAPDNVKDEVNSVPNIYQALSLMNKDNQNIIEPFKTAIKENETGILNVKNSLGKYYMHYQPMGNGWYLVNLMSSRIIEEQVGAVMNMFIIFILFVSTFVFILFLYMFKMKRNHEDVLLELAYVDSLTKGKNFECFKKDVLRILDDNDCYAIVTLDINDFGYINNYFGFEKGNYIIKKVHHILKKEIGKDEMVARINADIFILLLKYGDYNDFIDRINKINRNVKNIENQFNDTVYYLTYSMGIYILNENNKHEVKDMQSVLDKVKIARLNTKKKHLALYTFFDENIHNQILQERELENDMKSSLQNKNFKVYYQPKYNAQSEEITGAEALVRWDHPTKGLLSPGIFIPLFEKNEFIIQLDYYILEKVCIQLNVWKYNNIPLFPISINFSRLHFYNSNFAENIINILEKYNVSPEYIQIEILEDIFMEKIDNLITMIEKLRNYGIKIFMDDFGSGYSSLNMLKDISVDAIKLDRLFLFNSDKDEKGFAILKSIVKLSKELGMKVVAEGVETKEQLEFMKEIECDEIQGFYFSKPIPEDSYTNKLKEINNTKKR